MAQMFSSAYAFNQPLSFDTSKVTNMAGMFQMFDGANSLSNANKLLIRCAWAGTLAFEQAGYDLLWGPGDCEGYQLPSQPSPPSAPKEEPTPLPTPSPTPSPTASSPCVFTSTSLLKEMVVAYSANPIDATRKCGPIGDWDVSAITDMSELFENLAGFNEPLTNLDTSKVTTMYGMFWGAEAFNQPLSFDTSKVTTMSLMFYGAEAFNQPLSFDTSKVTDMTAMFSSA